MTGKPFQLAETWTSAVRRGRVRWLFLSLLFAGVLGGFGPPSSRAQNIGFQVVDLADTTPGEDLWQYRFLLLGFNLEAGQGFSVFFEPNLFSGLVASNSPSNTNWDVLAVQPDLSLNSPGYLDGQALTNGPSPTFAVTVNFVWRGTGTPGALPFVIYNTNYATILSGQTVNQIPPDLVCPSDIRTNTAPGQCGAVVSFTVTVTGTPSPSLHCQPASGDFFPAGTNMVACTASNVAGTATCFFLVTVLDTNAPAIVCATNQVLATDPALCSATPIHVAPSASDNCGMVTMFNNAPSAIPVGTTEVVWTVTDVHGNSSTCTQLVTVVDMELPSVICAGDVMAVADPGTCLATVPLMSPAVSDNCGIAGVMNNAPSYFPVGITAVLWTATDVHGNSSVCTQRVMVIDAQPPIITAQPQSRTNNVGTGTLFSVTADSCGPVVYQWCFNGSPLAGENGSTLAIPNVQLGHAGGYVVKMFNSAGATTSMVAVLTVNRPPLANPNGGATSQNRPFRISLEKLLENDSDADGDPLTVISVSAASAQGGAVNLGAMEVTYTPLADFTGEDHFTYTISDGRGGTATAEVMVFVADGDLPSLNQVSIRPTATGGLLIRFAGIPGRTYELQRTPTLAPASWTLLAPLVAPLHGIMEYEDTNPPQPSAFYRTIAP